MGEKLHQFNYTTFSPSKSPRDPDGKTLFRIDHQEVTKINLKIVLMPILSFSIKNLSSGP